MAKLLLIADTHGSLCHSHKNQNILQGAVNAIDAVFCMGDIYKNELLPIADIFRSYAPIYGIPGNHEPEKYIEEAKIKNIHGKKCQVKDITIAGMGGSIQYKTNPELCMMTDRDSVKLAKSIPKADILISHSSYKRNIKNIVHSGLKGISLYIKKNSPKYHFYGHLHNRSEEVLRNGTISICIFQAAIFDSETGKIQHIF